MRIKLDENMDVRLASMLRGKGRAADTALDEGLSGASDDRIYEVCLETGQTLVTLDLDFANPARFPPGPSQGIVVLRPKRQVLPLIRDMLLSILPALEATPPTGALWIVEPARIRVYEPESEP